MVIQIQVQLISFCLLDPQTRTWKMSMAHRLASQSKSRCLYFFSQKSEIPLSLQELRLRTSQPSVLALRDYFPYWQRGANLKRHGSARVGQGWFTVGWQGMVAAGEMCLAPFQLSSCLELPRVQGPLFGHLFGLASQTWPRGFHSFSK